MSKKINLTPKESNKEVKEELQKAESQPVRMFTEEEVRSIVNNATSQFVEKLRQYEYELSFRRLDYLFKIVELKNSFEKEFVSECAEEIKSIIKIEETETPVKE